MAERLIIAARAVAIAVLALAVLVVVMRWKFPVHKATPVEGTSFWKRLREAWLNRRRGHLRRAEDMTELRGKTALLIDPDPKSARVMAWKLEQLKCAALTATNGRKGMELARADTIDFIIADSLLPDISAIDLCNAPDRPNVPLVFVGVLRNQWDELRGLGGSVGLLPKPYDPDEAAALAGRLLRKASHVI
ncbi:MAG: response regulator [Armatimonadetes bacterium]|nr:response regulator [Armatimonadota bacterium]